MIEIISPPIYKGHTTTDTIPRKNVVRYDPSMHEYLVNFYLTLKPSIFDVLIEFKVCT